MSHPWFYHGMSRARFFHGKVTRTVMSRGPIVTFDMGRSVGEASKKSPLFAQRTREKVGHPKLHNLLCFEDLGE